MIASSLDMLEDSLIKKIEVMDRIEEENNRQTEVLKNSEEVDEKAFDDTVEKKGELVDQLLLLDEGFQSLFDRVKEELGKNKDMYKEQVGRLQNLIHEVMDRSSSIEAHEHRNKKLAEQYFSTTRQRLENNKKSSAVAFNYYQTMNKFKDIPPQFLDQKN
ncbi:flagellar protein FliT [Butyrivibrio sp. DSM 10294]|uniref:flagellar protein FliT n=1 Tax=Butyrivibrio sp. DSM 10294 TaxID=2972457 RepID=UPI00234ED936|nr:flagellar protein FliT [Butyrivibrio sp. DSM 10294]MDC7293574.1 flagellar protein FliT [Butyrivibrio sp. DSM 10294]